MSKPLNPCFKCGGEVNLIYDEHRKYIVRCRDCGQYVSFSEESYTAAADLWNAMFAGQTLYPIDRLETDDSVLVHRIPIEEPPKITSLLDCDFNATDYTHFTELPEPRLIWHDGKIKLFEANTVSGEY
jgi:hypothetical protein